MGVTADFRILVDADACPRAVKEMLYRAAERVEMPVILVSNQPLRVPPSRFLRTERVGRGFDVADRRILELTRADDLVITADIPLAAEVVARGAHAIDPRGVRYTEENIRERLAVRDLMDELRSVGEVSGGPPSPTEADRRSFANELDRFLTRRLRHPGDRG